MRYRYLPWILQQEGNDFRHVERVWKPVDLLYIQQTRALLSDMRARYEQLTVAQAELQTLDHADLLTKLLTRMRMYVRHAGFAWKADHLVFIRSVSGFYSDYGTVIRALKTEQERGRFIDAEPSAPTPSDRVLPRSQPAHPSAKQS